MIPEIIADAKSNDVQILLNISTQPEEFNNIIDISNKYKNIYSSIGPSQKIGYMDSPNTPTDLL